MAKVRQKNEVVVGAFYQRSSNPLDVVYSTGGSDKRIHGYDARGKPFDTTPQEVLKWTQLAVNDFPSSRDPDWRTSSTCIGTLNGCRSFVLPTPEIRKKSKRC